MTASVQDVRNGPDSGPGTGLATQRDARSMAAANMTMPETSPITDLLRKAVEAGTPVEQLRELVGLHKEMAAIEAAQQFAVAMAAFQAECPPIKKGSTAKIASRSSGTTFEYTYAELDDIARVINPILTKYGLSYTWDTTISKENQLTCVCTVRHLRGHFITSTFSLPIENASAMSPQQKVGAAATFAQRRSLSAALGLTTTDDDPDAVAAANPEIISADQLTVLEDLLEVTGVSRQRYLKYLGIEKLSELPAVSYQRALVALQNKKAELARGR